MTNLTNLTVQNPVVQNTAATADNHLIRRGEAMDLVAQLLGGGVYNSGTTYGRGVVVSQGNALYGSLQANNLNHSPATNPSWWQKLIEGGSGGGMANLNINIVAGSAANLDATFGVDLTGVTVNFIYQRVTPTDATTSGYAIDLTAQSDQTRSASILDAATGRVRAALSASDTATPGIYRGQFQFTSGGVLSIYPEDGWIEFEIVAAAADSSSHYLYVAYASDAAGTGFSLSPSSNLPYVAWRSSNSALTPTAADFAGRWVKFIGEKGDPGTDATGNDGASSYTYVAWASDTNGTGFSTTPSAGLYYIAVKVTDTEIASPQASDFTGLWLNLRGPGGQDGNDGDPGAAGASVYGYVGYASDSSGSDFSLTPGSGLNYVAFKLSSTVISNPQESDFTGLWKQYAVTGSGAIPADTDDLAEGSVNLYFTTARVLAAVLAGMDGNASGDVANGNTVIAAFSKLQNRLKTVENAMSSPGQALFSENTISVANGDQTGTVTGLALAFSPTKVQLTVEIPVGGTLMYAAVVGAPTTDGFAWKLSSAAPATGYKIHYRIT